MAEKTIDELGNIEVPADKNLVKLPISYNGLTRFLTLEQILKAQQRTYDYSNSLISYITVPSFSGGTFTLFKNTKLLIANGLNGDGTLKNIEYITIGNTTLEPVEDNILILLYSNGNLEEFKKENYKIGLDIDKPTDIVNYDILYFSIDENKFYKKPANESEYIEIEICILGEITNSQLLLYGTPNLVKFSDFIYNNYIIEEFVAADGKSGYEIYMRNGKKRCHQWGLGVVEGSTITFLKEYKDINYLRRLTIDSYSSAGQLGPDVICFSYISTTGFKCGNAQYGWQGVKLTWEADGEINYYKKGEKC